MDAENARRRPGMFAGIGNAADGVRSVCGDIAANLPISSCFLAFKNTLYSSRAFSSFSAGMGRMRLGDIVSGLTPGIDGVEGYVRIARAGGRLLFLWCCCMLDDEKVYGALLVCKILSMVYRVWLVQYPSSMLEGHRMVRS